MEDLLPRRSARSRARADRHGRLPAATGPLGPREPGGLQPAGVPAQAPVGSALRQRISYFGSLFAYAAGASRLAMITIVVVVLVGGVLPAHMSVLSLGIFWAPWTLLAVVSASALCRGHLRMGESSHYTLITAAIFTRALRCALVPSRTKFKVTPKEGVDAGGLHSLWRLRLVSFLGAALAGGLIWRALGLLGEVRARPLPAWAATFAMALGTWELYRVVRSLRMVFKRRQGRSAIPLRVPRAGGPLPGGPRERLRAGRGPLALGGCGSRRRPGRGGAAPRRGLRSARSREQGAARAAHRRRAVGAAGLVAGRSRVAARVVGRGHRRPVAGQHHPLLLCRAPLGAPPQEPPRGTLRPRRIRQRSASSAVPTATAAGRDDHGVAHSERSATG